MRCQLDGLTAATSCASLVLLGLAFGFAYFDRMALTFLAPFVQADLKLSNEELGWANSGLSLTWALGAFLIGRWSDMIGRRKPFLIGALLLFSACSVLSGLSWSFETLLATRVVMGAAEGPFLPICLAIMAAASGPSRQALNAGHRPERVRPDRRHLAGLVRAGADRRRLRLAGGVLRRRASPA